jgi:WD40 repeat protein
MNVRTGERKQLLPCIEVSANAFAFTHDSSLMAFGTGNGVIYVFEIPSGAVKADLRDDDWVQGLKHSPSGLLIATRTDGISIWDTTKLRRVSSFSGGTCAEGGPCVWQYFDEAELEP